MIGTLRGRGGVRAPSAPPTPVEVAAGQEGLPTSPPYRTPPAWGPPGSVGRWFPRGACLKGRGHSGPWPYSELNDSRAQVFVI